MASRKKGKPNKKKVITLLPPKGKPRKENVGKKKMNTSTRKLVDVDVVSM